MELWGTYGRGGRVKVLEVEGVTKRFGGLCALRKVTLHVDDREIVGLIGPNGSGKTTLFNCIVGFYRPEEGSIRILGKDITRASPHQVSGMGVARTWQLVRVFTNLTVFQNMLVGQPHKGEKIFGTLWSRSSGDIIKKASEQLEFVNLSHLKDRLAGELSFGQRRLLEFARALMSNPNVILLDEPVAGVNPTLANKMLDYIRKTRELGRTFLVIEHDMPALMSICDRIYALSSGEVIAEGKPAEIQNNEKVIDSYFGA